MLRPSHRDQRVVGHLPQSLRHYWILWCPRHNVTILWMIPICRIVRPFYRTFPLLNLSRKKQTYSQMECPTSTKPRKVRCVLTYQRKVWLTHLPFSQHHRPLCPHIKDFDTLPLFFNVALLLFRVFLRKPIFIDLPPSGTPTIVLGTGILWVLRNSGVTADNRLLIILVLLPLRSLKVVTQGRPY